MGSCSVASWAVAIAVGLLIAAVDSAKRSPSSSAVHVQPYAADEARLPTAVELKAANQEGATVTVALLQLSSMPAGSNVTRALDAILATAVAQGADLAVTPATWIAAALDRDVVLGIAAPLAVQHKIAVGIAFESSTESCLLLVDRTGHLLAQHSKPLDSSDVPTVSDGFPPTVILTTKSGENVTVGLLLGHELLYPELPRLLMLSGAELILAPLSLTLAHLSPSEPLGATNLQRLCQTRAFENVAAVACVVPGSASSTQFFSRLELLGSASHTANGSAPTVYTAAVPLDILRQTRRGGSIWGDAYRRPYDYRELCGFADTLPPPALEQPSIAFTDDQRRHDESRASDAEHLVVGIMQMMASNESLAGNLAKAEAYAREAKQQGADVVLMPELWSSGYAAFFPSGDPAGRNDSAYFEWMDSATPLDGDFVRHFQRLAVELNMAIGTSYLERNEGGATPPRNSIAMIDRHGRVLYNYQKVHICSFVSDEAMTSAGRHFHTAALDVGKPAIGEVAIGSMICFDRENPESARLLALHGAEVLLVPNACGVGKQLLDQFAVRALENGVDTVMANHVSYHGEPPFAMNGNSPAYSFDGSTVHAPVEGEEGVFLARFNMTALRAYRASPLGVALRQIKPRPGLCNLQQTTAFEGARGALARFNTPL